MPSSRRCGQSTSRLRQILQAASIGHQAAVELETDLVPSVPIEDGVSEYEPVLGRARLRHTVDIGIEAVVAIGNDGVVLIAGLCVRDTASAGPAFEGHVVFTHRIASSLVLLAALHRSALVDQD